MLVGTDVCVCVVFVLEETGEPEQKQTVRLGCGMTISHADVWYRVQKSHLFTITVQIE